MSGIFRIEASERILHLKTEQKLNIEKIEQAISALDFIKIELIGVKLAERIINRLGPVGKTEAERLTSKKSDSSDIQATKMNLRLASLNASLQIKEKKPFLNLNERSRLITTMLWLIKLDLEKSFGWPKNFLEAGVTFRLSDYEPKGILEKISSALGITISIADVPSKYTIILKLNIEQTIKKSELVFSIIEVNQNIEISEYTFTIKELEEEIKLRASL